jgi:hypothetical protein
MEPKMKTPSENITTNNTKSTLILALDALQFIQSNKAIPDNMESIIGIVRAELGMTNTEELAA